MRAAAKKNNDSRKAETNRGAPSGRRQQVSLSNPPPPSPLPCLAASFESLSQLIIGGSRNKASSSSADPKKKKKNPLRSDCPHEKFIASRWGDFYSDGAPGAIRRNYENASLLRVAEAESPGPDKNTSELNFLLFFLLFEPAKASECRSPGSKEWEAFIVTGGSCF